MTEGLEMMRSDDPDSPARFLFLEEVRSMGRLLRLINEAYDIPDIRGNSFWLVREASHMGNPLPHVKGGDSDVIGGCEVRVDEGLKATVCMKSNESMFGVFCGNPTSAATAVSHKRTDGGNSRMTKIGLDAIDVRTSCRKNQIKDDTPEQTYKSDSPWETIENVPDEE